MTTLHTDQANTICRYLVVEDYGSGYSRIDSCWEKRELARKKAASNKAWRSHARIYVSKYVLYPNKNVMDFGIERFDSMITGISYFGDDESITFVGARAELVDSGVIGDYVLDLIGKSGTKSGCDEFGTKYQIRKTGSIRFELILRFSDEPQKPYGMSKADPYETDISKILDQFSAK